MTSKARQIADLGGDTANLEDISGAYSAGALGSRNKVINGDLRIDQRNAGASISNPGTSAVAYTLDRWAVRNATDAAVNVIQSTDAPTSAFTNSIELDVTTADTSIAAGQVYTLQHRIEGFNVNDLGLGKAGSRSFTVSFWHKHTKTGTYCVGFTNSAGNRAYSAEYTQAVADTWEQATISVPVDTTGTWLSTNGVGLLVYFVVAAGSNFHGTADTWAAANTFATSNQVNALDSTSNFFRITGVQLEAGDTATPFEHRSYGQELALCQRYYFQDGPYASASFSSGCHYSTTLALYHYRLPIAMRASPTFTASAASDFRAITNGTAYVGSSLAAAYPTQISTRLDLTISGATAGHGSVLENVNANAKLMFNAEL